MYNDYELLYLAQENNEDAVNELRKKYNSLLYAKALSYSRSSHIDIKELLNETELAFYKAIDNYIDKKNTNTDDNKKSRSIFAETIHQVCQQNGYYR